MFVLKKRHCRLISLTSPGVFGHLLSAVRIVWLHSVLCLSLRLCWHGRGRIGCAYYDSINFRLYIMEDSQDSAHYDLMHISKQSCFAFITVIGLKGFSVLDHANPDVVLTSARADDSFIDAMRDYSMYFIGVYSR